MTIRVGINGLGRIGKGIISAWVERHFEGLDIVMINDMIDPSAFPHLLKYDSVHGPLAIDVRADGNTLFLGDLKIAICSHKSPDEIPWRDRGVDVVFECTGRFTDREKAELHRKQGVKKVVISAPAKGSDLTLVMGVNEKAYDPQRHHVISNASCTTNCLAPVAKVLNEGFGVERGLMTTVHSYTNDQRVLDTYHKDPRRARASALSMIPTTTGAAKAIGEVLPDLAGRLDGLAIRVPTPNVSLVDLVVSTRKEASREAVNEAFRRAAAGALKGILAVSDEPLVSVDFNGRRESAVVDLSLTAAIERRLVKVIAWYDNETGFSHRMLDLAMLVGKDLG